MPLVQQDYLKLVVRNLPPLLPADSFFKACNEQFSERIKWSCYTIGKKSAKTVRSATAYVKLGSQADVLKFKAAFDGRQFGGEKSDFPPVTVEYAPLQRVPGAKVKRDPRQGTIEQDVGYREFLEALERGAEMLPSAALLAEPSEKDGKKPTIITPLMAHLAETTILEVKQTKQVPPKANTKQSKSKSQQQPQHPQQPETVPSNPSRSRRSKSQAQDGGPSLPAPAKRSKGDKQVKGSANDKLSRAPAVSTSGATAVAGSQRKGKVKESNTKGAANRDAGAGSAAKSALAPALAPAPAPASTSAPALKPKSAKRAMSKAAAANSRSETSSARRGSAAASNTPAGATAKVQTAGVAAREAARNALSTLAVRTDRPAAAAGQKGSPPPPPPPQAAAAAVTVASECTSEASAAKDRDKAKKKEKRVRPGFGAWQRSRPPAEESPSEPR